MPEPGNSQHQENPPTSTQGDRIETTIGNEVQYVAAGKNILQIIIDKLMLPPWLVYTLIACFLVVAISVVWFVVKATVGGILVALPTATLAPEVRACPDDGQCVLVADFAPADDERADEITRKILDVLDSEKMLSTPGFTVARVDVVTSATAARQRAAREQALIIVWGEVFHNFEKLNINFALTNQFGVDESHQLRPDRVHVFDSLVAQRIVCEKECFENLTTVEQVLNQVSTTIAYTAAGMFYYTNDQPEAADRAFSAALVCIGQPINLTTDRMEEGPTSQVAASSPVTASAVTALSEMLNCAAGQPIVGFNPASIYYYAGKAKILIGDYAAAIAYLQAAAQHDPKDPAAWIGIATAYASWLDQDDDLVTDALDQAKQRTDTLRTEKIVQRAPPQEIAVIDYELGMIAELAGTPTGLQTAQEKYAQAVEGFGSDNPDAYVALIALGRAQRLAAQTADAAATLGKALALDSQAPWAYLELAQVHRPNRAEAERQLKMARKVAPGQAYVDYVEGTLCESPDWQDFDCAEAAYTRALQKRPNSGWLESEIGEFYRSQGNWAQAAVHYERAVALRPNDPWARDRLAFVYNALGRNVESAQHYALILNELLHPQTRVPERYCALGQAQQDANLLPEALATYRICLDGLEDNDERRSQVEQWIADIEGAQ
jgi:tetratricopeptide (TPR) repeat protein